MTPEYSSSITGSSGGYAASSSQVAPSQGGHHGISNHPVGSGQATQVRSGTQGFPASHTGASMDSGFGAGIGQVMSYPRREREVGYPSSAEGWTAAPEGSRDHLEPTEQIPIPASDHGASQDTSPYAIPDFAQRLHQQHQTPGAVSTVATSQDEIAAPDDNIHTLGATSAVPIEDYVMQPPPSVGFAMSGPDDGATEEIQAGQIPAAYVISSPQDITSPSQPGIDSESAQLYQVPQRSAAPSGRKPLPKPRIDPNFVFAPKVALPSLFRRLIAGVIDLTIIACLAGGLTLLFGPKMSHPFPHGLHGIDLLATMLQRYTPQFSFLLIAFCSTLFLYSTLLLAIRGQTIGKMLCKLKVIDRNGKPFSMLGAFARSLAMLISVFAGLVGLTWILFDKEYRGLHDRLSGALVIQNPPSS